MPRNLPPKITPARELACRASMWSVKAKKSKPLRAGVSMAGDSAEMTLYVNAPAESSDLEPATDENTAELTMHANPHAESSDLESSTAGNTAEMTVHANAQPESSNLASETDADNPTVPENTEFSLPSARKLSIRHSKRSRRRVVASNNDTNVEVVVHGPEGDVHEMEHSSDTLSKDEVEEEEDQENEVLQLQDRLMKHREEGTREKLVKVSTWVHFLYVQWPKVKRRARSVLSWRRLELWRSHMKYILGHYGSGAYSYYNFLRWLFTVNFLFAVFLLAFVITPQFVWRATEDGRAESNRRSIARTYCLTPAENCTDCLASCEPAVVDNLATSANSTNSSALTVTECSVSVAHVGVQRNVIRGNFSDPEWFLCLRDECPRNVLKCFNDFLSGEGLFADSELFLGWYTNTPIRWPTINVAYDMPMAYLLTVSAVYGLSLILIVVRIGASFQEQYTHRNKKAGKDRNVCNSVFTGWDFNITQKQLASMRHKSIKRKLQELSSDVKERSIRMTKNRLLLLVLIRIVTNTFVIVCLVVGGVAIFYSVQVEIQQLGNTSYLSTAVITLINLIYPVIFGLLIKVEMYQKSRHALFMTLLRLWTVRFYSYFSLLIAVTTEIECTQPPSGETGGQCSLSFSIQDVANPVADPTADGPCPACWETVLGQKFYFNAIVNVAVSLLLTVGMDTFHNIASRFKCKGKFLQIFAFSREFEVPEGIIDLVEIQIIFWLGFFFAPMISVITAINLFLLFYVKRYSMQVNLTPSKELYLAAKKDMAYLLVLLATGLICLLPVGYTIANLVPSTSCGPFRGLGFFYNILDVRIGELKCIEQKLVTTFLSPGFLGPLFLFLVMVIIGLAMVLRAKGTTVVLLVNQLKLESDDKNFLHNLLAEQENETEDDVKDEVEDELTKDLTDGPTQCQSPTSPKLPSSVANTTSRTSVVSVSSLQGAADYGTLSRARQLRKTQDSSGTLGRTVMQLNLEAQKEASHGRKESFSGVSNRKESFTGFSGRKESVTGGAGRKESTSSTTESTSGRKRSSCDYNTMSRARQLRMSQDSGTLGRAVMQLNLDAQKEVNPSRKESFSDYPGRKESVSGGPNRKESTPDAIEESSFDTKESSFDTKESSLDTKESSLDTKESSPNTKESKLNAEESKPNAEESHPSRKESSHARKASKSSSATVDRAIPRNEESFA